MEIGKAVVDVFIVSSYAPTSAHLEAEWEVYYDALSAALARRPPKAVTIIGADTNIMLALVLGATLVIMTMISEAMMWLEVLELKESMTPVGGYESSWRHTNSLRFPLSSTRNTKSTWTHPGCSKCTYQLDHVFTSREDLRVLRYFSNASSASGQLIDSDHRAEKATLRYFWCPPARRKAVEK